MSTPSAEYWLSHAMTDWMKAARVAGVAAIADQYAEGKFQPPTEMYTFRLAFVALYPLIVCRKPVSCGSTDISWKAVASLQLPYGGSAQ